MILLKLNVLWKNLGSILHKKFIVINICISKYGEVGVIRFFRKLSISQQMNEIRYQTYNFGIVVGIRRLKILVFLDIIWISPFGFPTSGGTKFLPIFSLSLAP